MSVTGLDSLLHRPRSMGVALQKFLVVIRLDDQGMNLAQPLHDHFGRVTEISDEAQATRSGMKREANRIDRVMRHRESLDRDVANFELRAGAKNSPSPMLVQGATVADCF